MKSTESAGSGKHSFFRISGRYFEILTGLHTERWRQHLNDKRKKTGR